MRRSSPSLWIAGTLELTADEGGDGFERLVEAEGSEEEGPSSSRSLRISPPRGLGSGSVLKLAECTWPRHLGVRIPPPPAAWRGQGCTRSGKGAM